MMNEKETMEYIESLKKFGSVLGLAPMQALCEKLGNPQNDIPVVHIAGTNGKGSLVAYLSTVLKGAGYRTGRYISPVIDDYRENIQVNGRMITKKALQEGMEILKDAALMVQTETGTHPTLFEMETALAFWYFKREGCDIVILETGLGGRLDATNVVEHPMVCAITGISMDHMQFLGGSLEQIAGEKAGIIKEGCRVITAGQEPEVLEVLNIKAAEKQCPIVSVVTEKITGIRYGIEKQQFSYRGYHKLEIKLAGRHQIENAALAVEVLGALSELGFPVKEKKLREGLLEAEWPGRFMVLAKKPYFLADGAHNADAAKKLAESLRFYFPQKRMLFIVGVLKDKEYDRILQETVSLAEHIITVTPPENLRALPAYELAQEARRYHDGVTAADSLEEAVELSYLLADKECVIVAFGTLSFMGKLIRLVKNRDQIRRDCHGKSK